MATRTSRTPFQIHHDDDRDELNEDLEPLEDSRVEDDEDDQEEDSAEDSDYSDDNIDPAIQEDMLRFQETFTGIKDRFRLINRIGEGKLIHYYLIALD